MTKNMNIGQKVRITSNFFFPRIPIIGVIESIEETFWSSGKALTYYIKLEDGTITAAHQDNVEPIE